MKKYLIIIICFLLLTACTNEVVNTTYDDNDVEEVIPVKIKELYVDDNPITVGLYQNGKLIKDYKTTFGIHKEIGYFEVCFTNLENLGSSNVKYNFNKYYKKYQNIDNYKIGYYVKFYVGDEEKQKVILDPSSLYAMAPYLYVYLYDDVHQVDNSWYSHMEMKDVQENTIYSSIKLYTPEGALKITSPIELTVFTYDGDEDFDEFGYYRGNSKYTIMIEKNA